MASEPGRRAAGPGERGAVQRAGARVLPAPADDVARAVDDASSGGAAADDGAVDREPPRAGRREWAGLAVLALPCLVVSMDGSLLHLALPRLAEDLRPTGAQLLWIVDVYVFLGAGALLTMGALGDRLGRRRLLLWGAAAFAAASVLAALSTSAPVLIAARALLGLAGATLMPSTLALIRTMFSHPVQRRQALGAWTASFAVGGLVGPLVGGLVIEVVSWSAAFLVAVPPMLLLLALGPRLLPESRDPAPGRFDVAAAATSLVAVLAVVHGLKSLAAGEAGPTTALVLAAGVGGGAALARRARRRTSPHGLGALVGRPSFAAPLTVNAIAFFVLYGTQYLSGQYLQLVLGLSPVAAGLWGLPGTVGYLLGSAVGPLATRRARPVTVVTGGLLLSAAGFGVLTQVGPESGLVPFVVGSVVLSVGLAPVYALTTEMVVAAAPAGRVGSVSAAQETGAELGGALGIAALGSLSLVLFRAGVGAPPHGTAGGPEGGGETLAGVLAAARDLPGGAASDLAVLAREAFTHSFRVAEALGAVGLALAALVFAAVMRHVRGGDAARAPADSPR